MQAGTASSKADGGRALIVAVLAALLGCESEAPSRNGESPEGRGSTAVAEARFAGSARCGDCHEAQHAAWRASHHRKAMTRLGDRPDLGEGNDAALARTDLSSAASFEIGYAPLRQYLAVTTGGRFQVLPYARAAREFEAAGSPRWFRFDDEEAAADAWLGDRFNANRVCIECHTTAYRKGYDAESDAYASSWLELGVGCEACHGPSAEHAAAADHGVPEAVSVANPLSVRDAAAWVFAAGAPTAERNPPRSPSPVVDTCARCHSLRDAISAEPHAGAPFFEHFVPAVLDSNNYEVDGQIKEESYEYAAFLQSKMYRAGVGCEDCHEPHGLRLRAEGNALCATCHRSDVFDTLDHHRHAGEGPGTRCVDCHMPERTFMLVDGRRDHGFKIPRPDLTIAYGTPNPCNGCHGDRGPEWALATVSNTSGIDDARAALAGALNAVGRGSTDARALLTELAARSAASAMVRASALTALARLGEPVAGDFFGRMIEDPDPLVRAHASRLLTLAPVARQPAFARRLAGDEVAAVRHAAALSLARSAASTSSVPPFWERVLREYLVSLAPNYDYPEANVNAALAHAYLGEAGAAERRYRHALTLEPADVTALVNLADLYRMTGRDDEAPALLRRATAAAPDSAAAWYSLGLALQRSGNPAEALAAVGRAAELAPEQGDYPYAYALSLHSAGQTAAALAALDENLRRHPLHRPSLVAAASICRDAGDAERARRYARQMLALDSNDGFAKRLLEERGGGADDRRPVER
jgi:predicted CXXCH cytochrome family protein